MTITNFTPLASTIGGLMIGLAAAGMLLINGRIAGVSGIAAGLAMPSAKGDRVWRWAFILGLLASGALLVRWLPSAFAIGIERSPAVLIVAGVLVGVGTRIGSGCTSGHGVCGIGRGSPRSIVATITFILAGMVTVFIVQRLFGGIL